MSEATESIRQSPGAAAGWYEFATKHRAGIAALAILIFPLVMPFTALAVNILIYGLYALGFNLVFGYLGLLSFGHAALLGTGAYLCGIAIVHFAWPWYAAIAAGVFGGLLIALLIGVIAIRTRGIYFAMVTMALSQCVYYLFYQAVDWTGGENGLRGINIRTIDLFGLQIDFLEPIVRYYVIAAFVIAAFFVMSRILASPFGAVIEAVRENEMRARASGYDVILTRLLTFVLSGGFCGLAGALQALHLSIVPIEILHYETSGLVVMIALLGGMGTFFGPMIGAAVFLVLENLVSVWTVHWQLIVGAIFIACVLFFPAGIWGTLIARGRR
ncbi:MULTISPECIES: branched-chain amino acid ABC transporter permease [unclassified Bradyrhizobium]|uniref:branched-chain amino acid ABC transporter permease n=1 Tax=unclassified Bradyrhizobium TaxID=2631580 RepID=UPI0024795D31|nr:MULTISPECIES: branched-chain amino acid ABC transporter permease [unclassified Bradyrhizobium]WGS18665.1 branched-chain amino acid ABC transporter permease [Bradyrhizobium sp. ISRA463]WGS25488.1 branched-chain amino acid ABC transporter permease [Bradyrhizobium sp. ISRA464]